VGAVLGLPALGLIPAVPSKVRRRMGQAGNAAVYRIDRDKKPQSALPNAFATLRTSVLFRGRENAPRSILVTSSRPGEGKTTVSVNLALSLALLGRRVLLIDADVRRPCVHRAFALPNHEGLTTYLSGDKDWRTYVHNLKSEGISVLPSGPPSPNSAELLSTSRLKQLIAEATESFDFVIVDSPALFINIADARILSEAVEGSVFVVRSGFTPREIALRALDHARNLIGVVLNDLRINVLPGYYREYYGDSKGQPEAGKRTGLLPYSDSDHPVVKGGGL
jgi:capsular exopolysaccharide synthesis family protein